MTTERNKDFLIEVLQAKVDELDTENHRLINMFIDSTGNVNMTRELVAMIKARAKKAEQQALRAVTQEKANANLILSIKKQHEYDIQNLQNQIDTLKGVIATMLDDVDYQIVEMLGRGYTYRRIAPKVGMSVGGIGYRVKRLKAMGFWR